MAVQVVHSHGRPSRLWGSKLRPHQATLVPTASLASVAALGLAVIAKCFSTG